MADTEGFLENLLNVLEALDSFKGQFDILIFQCLAADFEVDSRLPSEIEEQIGQCSYTLVSSKLWKSHEIIALTKIRRGHDSYYNSSSPAFLLPSFFPLSCSTLYSYVRHLKIKTGSTAELSQVDGRIVNLKPISFSSFCLP